MQQSDVYYQLVSQHVSGIIMPIFKRKKPCVTAYGVLRWFCWMWLVAVVGRCLVGCEQCEGFCSTLRGLIMWQQDSPCMCNVKVRRVAVEKQ